MYYYYKIAIQFAVANAPAFDQIMPVLKQSKDHYNSRSLIAKNPKKIIDMTCSDDAKTLWVVLQSEAELPYPGKALRLFSGYLVDPNIEGNLSAYISGRQLFKMSASSYETESEGKQKDDTTDSLRIRAISLLLNATSSQLNQVLDIFRGC